MFYNERMVKMIIGTQCINCGSGFNTEDIECPKCGCTIIVDIEIDDEY